MFLSALPWYIRNVGYQCQMAGAFYRNGQLSLTAGAITRCSAGNYLSLFCKKTAYFLYILEIDIKVAA